LTINKINFIYVVLIIDYAVIHMATSFENKARITKQEALDFHATDKVGKLEISLTKPLNTNRDLSLAYSPGVGFPCLEIQQDISKAYDYTSKGNFVAVISNGTAVLGFGDIGHLAGKPVMEGKAALFKRFADIDSIDVEVKTKDVEEFINTVYNIGDTWGGINLEDIKSPECFAIEKRLREMLDIPVFHDDQHGTAIITLAGTINAAKITGRKVEDLKIVVNGAGAAGISCIELLKLYGVKNNNIIVCDQYGVIYQGRTDNMNEWKQKHAIPTEKRTLAEALDGADMVIGLSVKGAIKQSDIAKMTANPIIFAMANPEPEITPEEVYAVRPDAIVATGRSDYPNQVNNVMCFPFIFRGALDVRAKTINEEMKMAASMAIAQLASEAVPDEVKRAYPNRDLKYGKQYILPTPFDPRLIVKVSLAVAKAAMQTGIARKPIEDFARYEQRLAGLLDSSNRLISHISDLVSENPKTVVFAEGEDLQVIIAANMWCNQMEGKAILVGKDDKIREIIEANNITLSNKITITNASMQLDMLPNYINTMYEQNQRSGLLLKDCERFVKTDRNVFASCLVQSGIADIVVTGKTRKYESCLESVSKIIEEEDGEMLVGVSAIIAKNRMIFISNTASSFNSYDPSIAYSGEELAQIAMQTAKFVEKLDITPVVAFISDADFGNNNGATSMAICDAMEIMRNNPECTFEFEGEISPSMALNINEAQAVYPFQKLSKDANVLIAPSVQVAKILASMSKGLKSTVIGPVLLGMEKQVQIVDLSSTAEDIFNLTVAACADAI
jgi:malate dehydrogenase (oxaloacetate-decarboxylating)(NADP+)